MSILPANARRHTHYFDSESRGFTIDKGVCVKSEVQPGFNSEVTKRRKPKYHYPWINILRMLKGSKMSQNPKPSTSTVLL